MNSRPEITAMLSLSIQRHICPNNDPRIYWAREVTFDYATTNAVRVDFMKFKPVNNTVSGIEKGDFYCYEVKSSVEVKCRYGFRENGCKKCLLKHTNLLDKPRED